MNVVCPALSDLHRSVRVAGLLRQAYDKLLSSYSTIIGMKNEHEGDRHDIQEKIQTIPSA